MKFGIVIALGTLALLCSTPAMRGQTAAKPADITGQWHFVLDTPGGDRESDADFHLDGDKVTGKYGKADVAGTYTDGKMDLAFTIETDEAGTGTIKFKGSLEGDIITGDWEFTEYNGTFKAMRKAAVSATPPPAEAAPPQ